MDYPIITFQTPGRIFDRLLKESSLSDLKETVRKKLGLGSGSVIQFAQLRNGQLVDLEDEDDFDAFRAVAYEQRHVIAQVVLTENTVTEDSSVDAKGSRLPLPPTPANALPGIERLDASSKEDAKGGNLLISDAPSGSVTPPLPPTPDSALPGDGRLNANSSTSDPVAAAPRKKVVLKNEDGIEVNLDTLTIKISQTPPSPLALVRPLEDLSDVTYPEARGSSMPFHNSLLLRTEDQGVEPMPSYRTRSKRGEKRSEASKAAAAGVGPQAQRPAYGQPHGASQAPNFEPVVPLQMTENRWDRRSLSNNNPDSPEVVDRKVKALLNKLTMEKFDSISDKIIQWANRSENQKDGRTLIQVIRLLYEKATDEAPWSEMYARLCRKMMEQISPKVQDEGIRNNEGNPITGGQLFRKYLLNRCQEDFERGWFTKEATAAAAAIKATGNQAVKAANETCESGEVALYSEEYYAAQKAKRQGLGLIKFIGELFKVQMLTERIIHECIKKLLVNVQIPVEEEIESLCMLLTTVGSLLDNQRARAHLDIYFQRMQELSKNVNPQMQLILQDVIELRDRKWQARNAVAAPSTLAQIHEATAKEKADKEKQATQQRLSTSRGGYLRGGTRNDYPKADGRNSASRATAQTSDLSQFGRFSRPQPPITLGPSSDFAGEKNLKREAISRTSSSSKMFSALQEAQQESYKASEQPTKLVEEPPVSAFFGIWDLLVTFFKSST